jgi:hypothetical protein
VSSIKKWSQHRTCYFLQEKKSTFFFVVNLSGVVGTRKVKRRRWPRTSSNLFVRKKYDLVELNFECSVLGVRVCFVVLMFPFNPPELYGFRVQIYTYQINGSILFFSPSSGKNWGSKNVRRSKTISSVLSWSIFLDAPFNILVSFN